MRKASEARRGEGRVGLADASAKDGDERFDDVFQVRVEEVRLLLVFV